MSQTQFAQSLWSLASGEALSLDIGPGPRELSVTQGRVWLTQSGALEDVWLEPGQSVALASGSRVVLEAWPEAQFQLLVPPAACPSVQQRRRTSATPSRAKPAAAPSGLAAA